MPNGRCRVHGGASTGAKDQSGNKNRVTHGFYADALLPEERQIWERVELDGLDDEIRLMRVKLHRLVRLSGSADVAELVDSALEVVRKQGDDQQMGRFDKSELRVQSPRYADLIERAVAEIRKLMLARAQLKLADKKLAEEGDGDEHDVVGFEVDPYQD